MDAYFAIGNCGSDDEEEVAPGQDKDLEEDLMGTWKRNMNVLMLRKYLTSGC